MAAHGTNDARGAALLLASAAKECVVNPTAAREKEIVLNNVYQLLQGYRAGTYADYRRRPNRPTEGAAGKLTLMPPTEHHVREVRSALDKAVHDVFDDLDRDNAVELVESVLKKIVYPDRFGPLPEGDRVRAERFFDAVLRNLHFA
jgi:hypothetical protein